LYLSWQGSSGEYCRKTTSAGEFGPLKKFWDNLPCHGIGFNIFQRELKKVDRWKKNL
jgi:hypothetical protein